MTKRLDWQRARTRERAARPSVMQPTDPQLEFIAQLADELGVTIRHPPESAADASRIIDGLKAQARRRRQNRPAR
jgi:hypothetical protein